MPDSTDQSDECANRRIWDLVVAGGPQMVAYDLRRGTSALDGQRRWAGGAARRALFFGIPLLGAAKQSFASPPLLAAAGLLVLFCGVAALIARRFRPAATIPVTCGVGGLVLLAAAVTSGSLGPLLLVLVIFAVAWVLGYGVLCRLPSSPAHPIVSLPIAIALGLGTCGLLFFVLASLGWLNAVGVSALAVVVLTLYS